MIDVTLAEEDNNSRGVDGNGDNYRNVSYRNTRVKSEKIVTKFGESLNLVMDLVNISVRN